jgi:UDP-2-acetamido-3-amino-2,3-dideoxy-glucuronate N-acetyltransferase
MEARIIHLEKHESKAGYLCVIEDFPFVLRRLFYIIVNGETCGDHAHKKCKQLLIAVSGQCSVTVESGGKRETFRLDEPSKGLYIPAKHWAIEHSFTEGCVLLVACSDRFKESDYIRNYEDFV